MRLREIISESLQVIGSIDLNKFKPGMQFRHGMLGTVTIVKVDQYGHVIVKCDSNGQEVVVAPQALK